MKGAVLGVHGIPERVRISGVNKNLTDMEILPYVRFRDVLQEVKRQHSAWEYDCRRDPELGCGHGPPGGELRITEEELGVIMQIVNAERRIEKPGGDGDFISREYGSIVI